MASAVCLAGMLASASRVEAADLFLPLTGGLLGIVVDGHGSPQMGARVQVFSKYQRLVAGAFSAPDGRFAFPELPADSYSVRVSLESFLPVSRDKIAVKAGADSVLNIHLASLFSNIEVSYTAPTGAMTDDWKWVLRSSPATRPVTRLLGEDDADVARGQEVRPRVFSGTRGMLSVSRGDGGLIDPELSADLGTGFALSTNILGKNQVQLAGSFGQGATAGPAAIALCAIYSRRPTNALAALPEITLTVAQLGGSALQQGGSMPGIFGPGVPGQTLRTMSLSVYETADPLNDLHLEYGSTGESVDYVQHTSRLSPFARMTVDLGSAGSVIAAYSDGGRPDLLRVHEQRVAANADFPSDDLSTAVESLSRLPQISNRDSRLELERTKNYEAGYQLTRGARTYAVSGFYEAVSSGRLNVAGDLSMLNPGNLLSDGISEISTLNIGRYKRTGLMASVNQRLGQSLVVAIAYGREGGFGVNPGVPADTWVTGTHFLASRQSNVATMNLKAHVRHSGTWISADYGWVDSGVALPRHAFTTQDVSMAPGLNFCIRQPLPSVAGIPGHFEITADLRNLLAQGYLPVNTGDGHRLLIVQAPRSIRGGLNFIF